MSAKTILIMFNGLNIAIGCPPTKDLDTKLVFNPYDTTTPEPILPPKEEYCLDYCRSLTPGASDISIIIQYREVEQIVYETAGNCWQDSSIVLL